MRRPDLHDNFTRGGVERQRAQENDTDQSLEYHDSISFVNYRSKAYYQTLLLVKA
jgi:hypothetical protein